MSVQVRERQRTIGSAPEPPREAARLRLSPDAAAVLRLQQTAGNAAVTALVQRQETGGGLSLGGTRRAGPTLLGGEGLHLDPAIEAEMRRIELERHFRELLEPGSIRSAVRAAPLDLASAPPARPAWLPPAGGMPAPEPEPLVPRGAGPATPRGASPGDVLDAVMAVPAVDGALTRLRTQATDRLAADWRGLSGGGKAAVVTSLVTIGGGALAGALASPDSRSFLLDQLNGRDLPVPGVDGLSVSLSTQRDNLGVMFTLTSVVTCRSLWASDSCVRFGVGSREVARKDATFAPLAAQTDGAGTVFAETILLSGFSTDEGLRVRRCR